MRKFLMRENTKGGSATLCTEVVEEYEDNELKVTFLAETVTHTPKHTQYNAPLYEGDIVEVLLTLGADNVYLEVEVNELGALYVVKVTNRDGCGDIVVEPLLAGYVDAKVMADGKLWRTDISISLDKLAELGYNKSVHKVNYLRQNFVGERLDLYAVSPTMCEKFHKIQAFFEA